MVECMYRVCKIIGLILSIGGEKVRLLKYMNLKVISNINY